MTKLEIYDKEYERINDMCDKLDLTPAELIENTIEVIHDVAFYMDEDGTPIPDNATNGDVINKMFDAETAADIQVNSTEYWWNAPYQKGGKG